MAHHGSIESRKTPLDKDALDLSAHAVELAIRAGQDCASLEKHKAAVRTDMELLRSKIPAMRDRQDRQRAERTLAHLEVFGRRYAAEPFFRSTTAGIQAGMAA